LLTITDKAREKLDEFASQSKEVSDLVLRVAIIGRGPKGFQYDLQLIGKKDTEESDIVVEVDGTSVSIEEKSAQYMDGATLDFVESLMGGGFHFENPNPLWIGETERAVAEIIDKEVNPAVASHGGHVTLIGVQEDTAIIAFGGGCQGCGMADVTLKQGVETMITERVPAITAVVDNTDHAAGTNPFY